MIGFRWLRRHPAGRHVNANEGFAIRCQLSVIDIESRRNPNIDGIFLDAKRGL